MTRDEVRRILIRFFEAVVPNIRNGDKGPVATWQEIHETGVFAEAQSIARECGWVIGECSHDFHFLMAESPAEGSSGQPGELITQPEFPYGPTLKPLATRQGDG